MYQRCLIGCAYAVRLTAFLATLCALAPAFALAQIERLPPLPIEAAPPIQDPGAANPVAPPSVAEQMPGEVIHADGSYADDWSWHLLPRGLIWHSYMAGTKEPGFRSVWSTLDDDTRVWDVTLGGRVGLFRYGNCSDTRPEGWQIDIEGAAMPRLDPVSESTELIACDYRFGLQGTYGRGAFHSKFGYYHLSSHLGDEFQIANPLFTRINYVRDSAIVALGYYLTDEIRIYGEAAYAMGAEDGAEPWELQFGSEYSPVWCCGFRGTPFAAINAHLREELNFGGDLVLQVGWQWRQGLRGQRIRLGAQYYDGYNEQLEFFDQRETKIGFGIWYDY